MAAYLEDFKSHNFIAYLESQGIRSTLLELPITTHTASAAAQAAGCDLSQIVKSLIFKGQQTGCFMLVLVSGPNKADVQRLSEIVGEKVQLADKESVLTVSGYTVGAVPPAGLKTVLPTLIDEDLAAHTQVWVSGGSDHSIAAISFQDLCHLTNGKVTTVNRPLAEPVIIMPYDPKWVVMYEGERLRIQAAMGTYLKGIEHIGSTAIPGLPAKPIIDILGGITSLLDAPAFISHLEEIGYCYIPEYESQLPQRRYLTRSDAGHVVIHLHVVEITSSFWQEHLAFRDRLRSDDNLRDTYGRLKIDLAANFGNDRVGYTNAKAEFIHKVLHQELT